MRSLVAPLKSSEISFDNLVDVMKIHYCPSPSEIVQYFEFHNKFRQPRESISIFISELRALAEHCNFGTILEDMLRDHLVYQNYHQESNGDSNHCRESSW